MYEQVRVGIIGCGVISATHIESYQQIEDVEVRWVCDLKEDRTEKRAEQYDIPNTTTDYREVLADDQVDLISVCTDHFSHAEITQAAFEAGKHVICEKALMSTGDGLDAMLTAHAAKPELKFSGIFQHRFEGVNRLLRQMVDDGQFGEVLTATVQVHCLRPDSYYDDDWHGTIAKEGGSVLINQAIHFVDALAWIMGGVKSLCAVKDNLAHKDVIETEDTLTAALRFYNGALGTIEVTSASHINWEFTLAIHGTEGSIELRNNKPLKVRFADDQAEKRVQQLLETARDPEGVEGARSHYGTAHTAQIADFIEALRNNRDPFVTGEMAAHANRIVLACYQSAEQGKWVDVPAPVDQPKSVGEVQ